MSDRISAKQVTDFISDYGRLSEAARAIIKYENFTSYADVDLVSKQIRICKPIVRGELSASGIKAAIDNALFSARENIDICLNRVNEVLIDNGIRGIDEAQGFINAIKAEQKFIAQMEGYRATIEILRIAVSSVAIDLRNHYEDSALYRLDWIKDDMTHVVHLFYQDFA